MFDIGRGLYSLGEAASLIGVRRAQLKRWLYGYDFAHTYAGRKKTYHSEPLWHPAYVDEPTKERTIGFADLLEARIVNEFVKHGVHPLVVRRCLEKAREIFKTDYPLTSTRFCTDGRTIYAEALADIREHELLDLRSSQFAFRDVIKPSLYAGIEYRDGHASRWFPLQRSRSVVIDPDVQFGKPVTTLSQVPTGALYACYLAERKSRSAAAKTFDVSPSEVDAAVRFETSLAREVSH
ncbi:DUF433 domain-containing protein [Ramlibacter albus]|uniref:DUF433 domain-containing protein n=1 Tax=Ramlibacter albus TaxID=2079448 RepID=A0A923M975_9BURK|nr:DUF433 domain-containing protein [Ramlibacter albus]MBC5765084.1 DUF433 domain-containing protein [Ramlibacter albus]